LDPQYAWYSVNKTIADFLKEIPASQSLKIRGEDLLNNPDSILRGVAAWIGVRTDVNAINTMKHPERSPYAFLGPPGARYGNDISFLENPSLRQGKAAERLSLEGALAWRSDGEGFCEEVQSLAREFGYE